MLLSDFKKLRALSVDDVCLLCWVTAAKKEPENKCSKINFYLIRKKNTYLNVRSALEYITFQR